MPKRISIAEHSNITELEQLYKQAKDGIESRQYQIIWLLAQGKKTLEVEEITGYSRTWIYALVKRYNELGIYGIGDQRSENQGAKALVDDIHQALLWQALQEKAPDGGFWNGRKVADWLSEVTGTTISRQRGWEILRQMSFRLRVPRPSHTKSDPIEQEVWKKKLATEVEELKATYPDAEIQLWCEDEHRLGLKPIIRRVYVPEGETPIANVNWRFKWLWLYAFVHPQTGETYWWILKRSRRTEYSARRTRAPTSIPNFLIRF